MQITEVFNTPTETKIKSYDNNENVIRGNILHFVDLHYMERLNI